MSDVRFRPIRGTEASIEKASIVDGRIYFATDSGKMFMDKDKSRIPIGGGTSGIHYANKVFDKELEVENFIFSLFDIEGNEDGSTNLTIPKINDLILNIPDGSFYRVLEVNSIDDEIICSRLTIAGSGGGGNVDENIGKSKLTRLTPTNITVLTGKEYKVGLNYSAIDGSGNEITTRAKYRVVVNDEPVEDGYIGLGDNYFDVTEYLTKETNTIAVTVDTWTGLEDPVTKTLRWEIKTAYLALKWEYDETQANDLDEEFKFEFSVSGNINKKVHIQIGNYPEIVTESFKSSSKQTYTLSNPREYFQHGAIPVTMYASTELDGFDKPEKTDGIVKQMIFYDKSNKTTIISCGLHNTDLNQYDTTYIPIVLYNVENINGNATVVLKEYTEGQPETIVDTWPNVKNNETNYWAYTPTTAGSKTLIVQSGNAELSIRVNVIPLNLELEEIPGYAFEFKANKFASNNAIQNWNSNGVTATFSDNFDWINGGLQTEEYLDKGIKRNRQCVVVKAGTNMTINYKLFEKPACKNGKSFKIVYKTTGCYDYDATFLDSKDTNYVIGLDAETELDGIEGRYIKYAATAHLDENLNIVLDNVQEAIYDLSNTDFIKQLNNTYIEFNGIIYYHIVDVKTNGELKITWRDTLVEDKGVGLLMTAQTAYLRSTSTKNTTPYCEDTYMEFEFDVWPNGKVSSASKKTMNFVQTWLDGVPCSINLYPTIGIGQPDEFDQVNYVPITIGSPDCDVVLYLVKLYETHLDEEQHLTNFILDAPNATEMLNRFKRNDILNDSGEISYEKLSKANPDCLVHLYDVDKIPISKDSKFYVLIRNYKQYQNNELKLQAEDALYKVQGTSSAKYVVSAANLDTNFKPKAKHFTEAGYVDREYKPTLKDGQGKDLLAQGGWAMDDKALPCTYFTTKVNVASCEQANNSLNQEWYNQYQPYQSSVRKKKRPDGKLYRDTMQFKQGVIFLKDNNPVYDDTQEVKNNNVFKGTEGYKENPWFKMYSIGAMGNSKKNTHVFHDEDNPLECCIENGDNQLPGQWMTVPQGGYVKDNVFYPVDIMVDDIIENGNDGVLCPDGESRNAWDLWKKGMDEIYGFRYPDGIDEAFEANEENATKMVKAWYDFVKWMALSNPSPKYKAIEFKNENEFKASKLDLFIREFDEIDGSVKRHIAVNNQVDNYNSNAKYYTTTSHKYGYTDEPLPELVNFGEYQFKDEQHSAKLISSGVKVADYIGNYTHDTYKYRMAKMLNECENHLVMDSVVYHYLFIERHTMIDNVAKNTFWSSSDLQHWDLTKDYDNDTADGNDNQGKLSLTYGYEVGDAINGKSVFNAPNSVWLNFIDGLYSVRQAMYKALDNGVDSPWDETKYLQAFEEWQNVIPERCWIEDYYRKYIRPYEIYGDIAYFDMLEGGQKKHQRKQYEHYQNIYVDSEYFGAKTKASNIVMRGNNEDKANFNIGDAHIPVKVYSDCYIWGGFGTGPEGVNMSRKIKRGEIVTISSPTNDITDATIYLYPGYNYQQIGSNSDNAEEYGLEVLNMTQFITSNAPKLSVIVLGSGKSGSINRTLTSISFEGNPLLKELYACGYYGTGNNTVGLDLNFAKNLQVLDLRSSPMFGNIQIANGAPLKTLHLDAPSGLTLHNLNKLETLTAASYNALSLLDVDNIDTQINGNVQYSKNIIKTIKDLNSNLKRTYILKNINWTLNSDEIGETPIDYLDFVLPNIATREEVINGVNIKVTDTNCLTGKVMLNNEYDAETQYNIYDKYCIEKQLSKLDIEFNPSKLYTVEIYNGNNNVVWSKKIIGNSQNHTINKAFLESDPNDKFVLSKIDKAASLEHIYTFTKTWMMYNLDDPNAPVQILNRESDDYDGWPIYDSQVTCNTRLVPIFTEEPREYYITFYDANGNYSYDRAYVYGTYINEIMAIEPVPYKDDRELDREKTYSFIGYTLTPNSKVPVSADYKVQNNQSFYPLFDEISVYDNVHPEYFAIETAYEYQDRTDNKYNLYGVRLTLIKPIVGKLTIPSYYEYRGENLPVISINDSFRALDDPSNEFLTYRPNGYQLTDVFFREDSMIREFGNNAFRGDNTVGTGIHRIDFPKSLRVIGESCFSKTPLRVNKIGAPSGVLDWIKGDAFYAAFDNTQTFNSIEIASSVTRIDARAFSRLFGGYSPNPIGSIASIIIGTEDNPSNLMFGSTEVYSNELYIFKQNSSYPISNIYIYLTEAAKANLDSIENGYTDYIDIKYIKNVSVKP